MPLKTISTQKHARGLARALGEPSHIAQVRIVGVFPSKRAFAEALNAAKLAYSVGVETRDATLSAKEYPDLVPGVLYALRVDGYGDAPQLVSELLAHEAPSQA